jgi:long-chain acyl-CoA synthetase
MLTVPLFMEKIYRAKVKPGLTKGVVGILSKIPGIGRILILIAGAKLQKTFGGRIKFFGVGGAPLAPEVAKFLFRARFPYAIGYGLTETSPLVAGHLKGRLYSTGRVLKDVEVRISEPQNETGAGEILVKGPNVMAGYYHDPVATAAVFTDDGWFRTGDLGHFDRHGHLHIAGRSKNLILGPSGENIYPEALEALINQDRLVAESLVLRRGQDLVAKVVLDGDVLREVSAPEAYLATLRETLNRDLARFSRLSCFEVEARPFEKTATLKIKRYLYA